MSHSKKLTGQLFVEQFSLSKPGQRYTVYMRIFARIVGYDVVSTMSKLKLGTKGATQHVNQRVLLF